MITRDTHSTVPFRSHARRLATAVAVCSVGLCCIALLGCDESRECERLRVDLFKSWEEVNKAIEERKLNSAEASWTAIQTKVDVLQSAFATTQVTWDSASKNRDEAASLVTGVTDSGQGVEIFRATFNAAGAKQSAYYKACR